MFTGMSDDSGERRGGRFERLRESTDADKNQIDDWLNGSGSIWMAVFAILLVVTLIYVIFAS